MPLVHCGSPFAPSELVKTSLWRKIVDILNLKSLRFGCLFLLTIFLTSWLPAQTISSITVNPKSVGGAIDSTGKVTLSAAAPAGGAVVTLTSSLPKIAQVPTSVTVPQSQTTATFTVTTSVVFAQYAVNISGSYNNSNGHATLTVRLPTVHTATGGFVGDKAVATKACVMFPQFGSLDSAGNIYLADDFGNRIRMYNATTHVITTVAGDQGQYGYNGEGIPATKAAMGFPRSVVVFDSAGDFYYTDDGSNRIRAVVNGIVNTVIGNGTGGYMGDGGPGTSAEINQPTGLAVDASGNLYFSDTGNQVIRVWSPSTLIVNTVVGNGTAGFGGDGGPPLSAELDGPRGIGFDSQGNFYIADTFNSRIRTVTGIGTQSAVINTIAGNGGSGFSGDGGPATHAAINFPRGVLVSSGTLYISNAGHSRVRSVNLTSNVINTYAGFGYGYDGENDPPLSSRFETSTGLLANSSGEVLVIDAGQSRVREVTPSAVPTIIGGYRGDNGKGTSACLNGPENMAFSSNGTYYIAEASGNHVRKVGPKGTITTLVDTSGVFGYTGDGGGAGTATIEVPMGVAPDPNGNVYLADNFNNVIRKVNSSNVISTFDADLSFVNLVSLTTDSLGNVYSVDSGACVVREITPQGASSIIAGVLGICGYNGDGISATTADLNQPYGIALDANNNIYIGDAANNRVRVINSAGTISTMAGTGVCGFTGDGGLATSATLCAPSGVTVDSTGRVFIADYNNNRVRVVDATGTIYTYLGSGLFGYNGEGRRGPFANLGGPIAVSMGPGNVLYYVDDLQYRVRKVE